MKYLIETGVRHSRKRAAGVWSWVIVFDGDISDVSGKIK